VRPIFDAGLVDLVEMDHRISPEVQLTPKPGHPPGHVSVVIEVARAARSHHRRHCPHPSPNGGTPSGRRVSTAILEQQQQPARSCSPNGADQPILYRLPTTPCRPPRHVKRDGAAYRFEV